MIVANVLNVPASRLLGFPPEREGNGAYWLLTEMKKERLKWNNISEELKRNR